MILFSADAIFASSSKFRDTSPFVDCDVIRSSTDQARESVHLQTVLAMFQQEIDQHRAMPSYQRLKTMARRHIDQTTTTRNFRVRNGRIETGVLVTSQKGKLVSVERKSGECYRKQNSVQEETLVVSATGIIVDSQHNRLLLLQDRRHKMTEKTFERKHPKAK